MLDLIPLMRSISVRALWVAFLYPSAPLPSGMTLTYKRDIITKMGLFDAVKARNTTEEGLQFIREDGSSIAAIPASANGPTAELEILRGDFAEVLYDATKEGTRYIFGDCIVAIDDEENGTVRQPSCSSAGVTLMRQANKQGKAEVTFKSGRKEEFDVVIIADGVRSRTRKLVFGDEVKFKRLGMCECSPHPLCPTCR